MYWSDPPDKEDQTEHTDNKEYDRFATSGKMPQTVINLGQVRPVTRTSCKSEQVGCKLTLKMLGKSEPCERTIKPTPASSGIENT